MSNINFSIIIPTYNGGSTIENTLSALCEQKSPECNYEIITVDNNSTDNTSKIIKNFSKNSKVPIKYICENKPGSSYARNKGFKVAKGEIIGLIDDDIIVNESWVSEIFKPYSDPKVGAVGGKILLKWINGKPPTWFKSFESWLGKLDYGPEQLILDKDQNINAGNYSIRKDILFNVGGYPPCDAPDDKLVGDGEVGLNRKVLESGKKIIWMPSATGLHVNDAKIITKSYMLNRAKYYGKSEAFTFYQVINGSRFSMLKQILKMAIEIIPYFIKTIFQKKYIKESYYFNLIVLNIKVSFINYLLQINTNYKLRKLISDDKWL